MTKKSDAVVTMRVKIGEAELEVTGPQAFVEEKIESFVTAHRAGGASALKEETPGADPSPPPRPLKKQGSLAQLFKKLNTKSDVERTPTYL